MTDNSRRCVRQYGFTLIEIMVVVMILGLLATIVAVNAVPMQEDARIQKARADVKSLHDAAAIYRMKHGRWPTLLELTARDQDGWAAVQASPDPWQHEYVLQAGDRPGDFTVKSLGPDGQEGTADDIVVGAN